MFVSLPGRVEGGQAVAGGIAVGQLDAAADVPDLLRKLHETHLAAQPEQQPPIGYHLLMALRVQLGGIALQITRVYLDVSPAA